MINRLFYMSVVIVILGYVAVPNFTTARRNAKKKDCYKKMKDFNSSFNTYIETNDKNFNENEVIEIKRTLKNQFSVNINLKCKSRGRYRMINRKLYCSYHGNVDNPRQHDRIK